MWFCKKKVPEKEVVKPKYKVVSVPTTFMLTTTKVTVFLIDGSKIESLEKDEISHYCMYGDPYSGEILTNPYCAQGWVISLKKPYVWNAVRASVDLDKPSFYIYANGVENHIPRDNIFRIEIQRNVSTEEAVAESEYLEEIQ